MRAFYNAAGRNLCLHPERQSPGTPCRDQPGGFLVKATPAHVPEEPPDTLPAGHVLSSRKQGPELNQTKSQEDL